MRAADRSLEHGYGETRPCELNATVAHAAALADQTPDPQLAALIALAALVRNPYTSATPTSHALVKVGAALSRLRRASVPELRSAALGDGRLSGRRFDRALVALLADGRVRAEGGVLELMGDDGGEATT